MSNPMLDPVFRDYALSAAKSTGQSQSTNSSANSGTFLPKGATPNAGRVPVEQAPFLSSEISSTGVPYNQMVFSRDMDISSVENAQDREFLGLPPLGQHSGVAAQPQPNSPRPPNPFTDMPVAGAPAIPTATPNQPNPLMGMLGSAKGGGATAVPTAGQPQPTSGGLGGGKGGGAQPQLPMAEGLNVNPPQQPQLPMANSSQLQQTPQQPGFNVNQAAAGSLQGAIGATQQAMQGPLNVGAYANPFTSAVIDRTQQDIARQQEMATNTMGAQATAANAFGGSRHGVAEGVMAGEYGRMSGDIAAQQRQANYSQALQAAMNDRTSRLGAASQLGGLGQQAFNTGQTIQGNQQQQGLLQQGIQQALIDAAKGQYGGYTGAPTTALQAPLAALGVTPTPQTTTNSMKPGLFNYLQLGASMFPK